MTVQTYLKFEPGTEGFFLTLKMMHNIYSRYFKHKGEAVLSKHK